MKKKVWIITGIALGSIAVGFLAYRIYSRWNKTVIQEDDFTILVKKDETPPEEKKQYIENEEVVYPEEQDWASESSGLEINQEELDSASALTDMGDY